MPTKVSSSKRLPPTAKTLRQLYVLSGNQCAKPNCKTVLVNANGSFVGAVCHIRAAKNGGPRFDSKLSQDERRAVTNLILLCRTCHALVDSEPDNYTVRILTKWKHERERAFEAIGNTLRQSYIAQVSDDADAIDITLPHSLAAYVEFLDQKGVLHALEDNQSINRAVADITSYVERLRHITITDRILLTAIIRKALKLDRPCLGAFSLSIHPDDLMTMRIGSQPLSQYRVNILGNTIERHNIGYLDARDEPVFCVRQISEHFSWSELEAYVNKRGSTLEVLLRDLQFSILD